MGALSFFGLGGAEKPPLQLYGKLPLAKDYLRVGCSQGSGLELRNLLDRTFGSTRAGEGELVLSQPLRFVGFDAREPLQGCIWPSSDNGGHRRFPFTLFVERKRRALEVDLASGAATSEALWRRLVLEYEACLACGDGRELLEAKRGAAIDLGGLEAIPGAAAHFETWLAALWPDDRERGCAALVAELARVAGSTKVFRLPLVTALPIGDQMLAWCRVLEHVGAIEREGWPTLFAPFAPVVAQGEVAALVAIAGRVAPEHVTWFAARAAEALGPGDCLGLAARRAAPVGEAPVGDGPLARALGKLLAAVPGTRS